MVYTRFLLPAALLLASSVLSPVLAVAPVFSTAAVAAGPYDNDYNQGYDSGTSYLGCGCRSAEDVQAERTWAENQQAQASSLHQYYYLQGYIDRLSEYF